MDWQLINIREMFQEEQYIIDEDVEMAIFLSLRLRKPLLIEGPAGVGKTEIAKTMACALKMDLIRLQCYEGLDSHHALYEWNYQKQLLYIKMLENQEVGLEKVQADIFSEPFLLKRPLLLAITNPKPSVLLIDEIDRADEEFESFLLEVLSDWQISIPEIGTIRAHHIPQVILTSNNMRPLSDALRRRCFYLWLNYPSFEKELAIIKKKLPEIDESLAREICGFVQILRQQKLDKVPGVSETLDWALSLMVLGYKQIDAYSVEETLGALCKNHCDLFKAKQAISGILDKLMHEASSRDSHHSFEQVTKKQSK